MALKAVRKATIQVGRGFGTVSFAHSNLKGSDRLEAAIAWNESHSLIRNPRLLAIVPASFPCL